MADVDKSLRDTAEQLGNKAGSLLSGLQKSTLPLTFMQISYLQMFEEALLALERNDRETLEAILRSQISQSYVAWESETSPPQVVEWIKSIRKRATESPAIRNCIEPPDYSGEEDSE